ncbi:hypothetical protein SAMN04489712_103331 [Thermomonospora echinospora]|uniref:Uncharacterized protein n=1 Tax=Thermomonospora echinospora TaxID=1992 RepID=A0A1H5XN62_9ACTN|nr:DUF6069 family protein [Thermomonospora echinospora]SEG13211.1 hypothetical protein SAMN04489712_103331 [Thermomonospora echinospora]
MAKVPFGPHPDDASGPRAHPRGRTRQPLHRAYRCPATARSPQVREASVERYRGFAALHGVLAAGPQIRVGRLWAGGLIAALCAVLVTVAGALVARGVLHVPVPVPVSPRVDGLAVSAAYALCMGALTLQATGLLHVLMLVSPRPVSMLAWVCGPVTGIATLAPLVVRAGLEARIATAAINLATGLVVIGLLAATASLSARWPGPPDLDPWP